MDASVRLKPTAGSSVSRAYLSFCDWSYSWVRAQLVPHLRNSQYAYLDALQRALSGGGRWLDVGCGHEFLPAWVAGATRLDLRRWITAGIDLDADALKRHPALNLRVHGDGERLPFVSGSFSLVTANMVVEHVREPGRLFSEIERVLVPGGVFVVHTPNAPGYTTRLARLIPANLVPLAARILLGRKAEDVYPTYYRANSASALSQMASGHGLKLDCLDRVLSSPQFVRIPPLMLLEMVWLRQLRRTHNAERRPCIVASFTKPARTRGAFDTAAGNHERDSR